MATWKLSDAEWEALDDLRFSTVDARVFRNATAILMSAAGRSKFSIAHDLGCSPSTVDHVRQRYRRDGLDGLVPRKPPGPPSRATAEFRATLRRTVETPPQSLAMPLVCGRRVDWPSISPKRRRFHSAKIRCGGCCTRKGSRCSDRSTP